MIVAVPRETCTVERRVAVVPAGVAAITKRGISCQIETSAGASAGFSDDAYREAGAQIVSDRKTLFQAADVVLQVRTLGADPGAATTDLDNLKPETVVIGTADPLGNPAAATEYASRKLTLFALELLPRISRAQSMDVLSSMATVAGYKAVLLAAHELPKMFPLLMTAAGTQKPARVLVIGAGVAGLQAIATARRLGAVVQAYDVRPAAREQIESLGASAVELNLATDDAEDKGGYAKALSAEQEDGQREQLGKVVAECDVVITTAAIPGRRSPLLITKKAVASMQTGSVVVDLAAERGGNCEFTQPDQTIEHQGVKIFGPTDLPSTAPLSASQMYSTNVVNFLSLLAKEGELVIDTEDEVIRDTLVTRGGEITNDRIRQLIADATNT
ncbi:Re/Si-specific NAD(P)(+) transhydrogenase subunit alpha [Aeoliella sp.]|uniref:Re/Si-specific NAD(P)(+) transhydrogenase subunit alpha n=1 Tax=Aeoliella sp. TaxID=2795800 RepID=UPI003CCBA132